VKFAQRIALPVAVATMALITGCSVLEGEKVDYKAAAKGIALDVPPDLTQLTATSKYAGSSTTSGNLNSNNGGIQPTIAIDSGPVARIERLGPLRWITVNRSPEQVWPLVREFWAESGFTLEKDEAGLGILETDWNENRAKIPQDAIRRTLGKVFDSLYSSGERDKFRTRVERGDTGSTEIYISHRGITEVYADVQKIRTVWQPRPSDSDLENEFQRRLLAKLNGEVTAKTGSVAAQAKTSGITSTTSSPDGITALSRLDTSLPGTSIIIAEPIDRAWRRVSLALDRTGFTVEDRDRSKWIFVTRYVPGDFKTKEEPGFFSRLFGGEKVNAAQDQPRLQLALKSDGGNSTRVEFLDKQGQPDLTPATRKMAELLVNDIK
jgi:outer membrane protein assembly factor BamC